MDVDTGWSKNSAQFLYVVSLSIKYYPIFEIVSPSESGENLQLEMRGKAQRIARSAS